MYTVLVFFCFNIYYCMYTLWLIDFLSSVSAFQDGSGTSEWVVTMSDLWDDLLWSTFRRYPKMNEEIPNYSRFKWRLFDPHMFSDFFPPYTPPLKVERGIVSPSPGGWWHGFKTTTQLGFSSTHSENYQMGYLTFRQSRILLVWFKVLACIGYRSHCIQLSPIKSIKSLEIPN